MKIGLGLDAGGSATRWTLCDEAGTLIAMGEVPSISGHLFSAAETARLDAATTALGQALAGYPRPDDVVAGITGLSSGTPAAAIAAHVIGQAIGIPASAVRVRDDTWIAFHAAFARGEGHMVYSGTGSIGVHVRKDATTVRVGGRGMLIDDAGSGFWIGREALNLVWRHRDAEPEWTSPLAAALDAVIGGSDWNAARTYVYGGGRTAVAILARAVAAADDADACSILSCAGRELARLGQALASIAGEKPVALIGRAAGLHPIILASMRASAPNLAIARRDPDPALAAARLALDPTG